MKKLIKIELIKILNYRPFQILIILYIVAISLGLVIYPLIDRQIPMISLSDLFRFPHVWTFMTWITEPYNIVLGLMVIMITTTEFNNHTFKTQVIFGLSRNELITQKLVLIVLLAIFATLLNGITSLLLGLTHSYKITFAIAMENVEMMGRYFLCSLSYMIYGLFFGLIIKNTALSLMGYLGYRTFFEPLLFAIFLDKKFEFEWYFPMRVTTRLTPLPNLVQIFMNKMDGGSGEDIENNFPKGLPVWLTILLAVVYGGLIIFFSYRLMRKKRLT